MVFIESYDGQLKLCKQLFLLRCEAAMLTSRNTDPNGAFTEKRSKSEILKEIKFYTAFINKLLKEGKPINCKSLYDYVYHY